MQRVNAAGPAGTDMPDWVPVSAMFYLAHTEAGESIRALARQAGCHASTILRRIRHFETRRDDLLVDEALRRLGRQVVAENGTGSPPEEIDKMTQSVSQAPALLTEARLHREALRVLRRLCEGGAVLAVAAGMEKAVIVRDGAAGTTLRTAVVEREVAEAMALKDWIGCDAPGRIMRYHITPAGRAALSHMLARSENRASGISEAQMPFDRTCANDEAGQGAEDEDDEGPRRMRYGVADSPLIALARRRDRDGTPFLSADMVRAGERLREDFETSQVGPRVTQDWDRFLTGGDRGGHSGLNGARGSEAARIRVEGALRDLGPGLGDIALRCCCHLEGLERAEKRMGWSARSGKIVLRIALLRLKRHYDALGEAGGMIG